MKVEQYLKRIGLPRRQAADHAFLGNLMLQHLLRVPFENFDVLRGVPIELNLEKLYRKIVLQQRGGFCYELNALFAWLLAELDYSTTMLAAGVYQAGGAFSPLYDHMALKVEIGSISYLVDVGFGASTVSPIALPDGELQDRGGRFRIRPNGDLFLLEFDAPGWTPRYRFSPDPQPLEAFVNRCRFHQSSPQSHFTRGVICTIARPNGRLTLSQQALTLTENAATVKVPIVTEEARRCLLQKEFGIHLPDR